MADRTNPAGSRDGRRDEQLGDAEMADLVSSPPETGGATTEPETGSGTDTDAATTKAAPSGNDDIEAMRSALAKANDEAAKARHELKELRPLARRAKELEDKDKTETQRLTEALAEAERAKGAAEAALVRSKVAADKGLPAGMADRLQGATEEEIAADADVLLATIRAAGGPPTPDLKQGDRGSSSAGDDIERWIRKEAGR